MDYQVLKTLLGTHPNYATATDQELLTWVNEEVINATKTELPNEQILATILSNRTEFAALSASDQQLVRDILYIGDAVPTAAGEPARDTLVAIFGAASSTIQTLAAKISYYISRAANAGIIEEIKLGDIEYARAL